MATKTIIFGREAEKRIPQQDISATHAKVTYLGNGEFEVEDLNSSNGTYVNGYRIRRAVVGFNDQVRLSSGTVLDLAKEFELASDKPKPSPPKKSNPKDFIQEFAQLKPIYEDFKRNRKKSQKKHQQKMALIRTGITLLPMPFVFNGGPVAACSLLASGIANFVTAGYDNRDAMEQLEEDFRLRYVCPNPECQMQLGIGNSWNMHYETGKCFRCGAIYNKSKLSN